MTPHTPTDRELYGAIVAAAREKVVLSPGHLRAFIHARTPHWVFAKQRLHGLLKAYDLLVSMSRPSVPVANALLVLPDDPARPDDFPLSSVDAMCRRIRPLHIELDGDGNPTKAGFTQALGSGPVALYGCLHPPSNEPWHYMIYGIDHDAEDSATRPTRVSNSLIHSHRFLRLCFTPFPGSALVVKKGAPDLKTGWMDDGQSLTASVSS
ncbi:hypothetical protein FA95DRAFT_1574810 [Auriscalpium vulgare]|uniref:Uncharacterized protein n=1 Tax=Auriscalpium vulgare TaxID=40419 RepID=A0ACB8RID2_9AGAM|nr:hypothetical protein FA95DRAFT_1574810 [Auriscalpium vulgare]